MKEEVIATVPQTEGIDKVGLAQYALAATLARLADGGGVLAVILLCMANDNSASYAGILAACITLPHLAGPFIARSLDTADDGRTVIALACLIHTVLIVTVTLTFDRVPLLATALLLAGAGLCGPLLTGGISTRLPPIAGRSKQSQRRAQGWDVATYGLGGTVGPSLVAVLAAWFSPSAAFYALAGATALAAFFIMRIPTSHAADIAEKQEVPSSAKTIMLMLSDARLRRTLYLTLAVAFCVAVLPVTAVSLAPVLGVTTSTAAYLMVAYGGGNLAGSAYLMLQPLKGEPSQLMVRLSCCIGAGVFLILFNMHFAVLLLLFFITGAINAFFFAATLAARSEYSPANCRGQVFVWVGALKITAGSVGTAIAGWLILRDSTWPLVTGITVLLIFTSIAIVELTRGSRYNIDK